MDVKDVEAPPAEDDFCELHPSMQNRDKTPKNRRIAPTLWFVLIAPPYVNDVLTVMFSNVMKPPGMRNPYFSNVAPCSQAQSCCWELK